MKLHAGTAGSPLAALQLFSSLAAFSAAASQGSYAAANAALEGLADGSLAAGRPALCVQWGNWGGGGMAARNPAFIAAMERMGLGVIDPGRGLALMARLLGEAALLLPAAPPRLQTANVFLWDAISKSRGGALPPFLSEFRRSGSQIRQAGGGWEGREGLPGRWPGVHPCAAIAGGWPVAGESPSCRLGAAAAIEVKLQP